MRQPKFRGYSKETNKWHYGFGWHETDYTDEHLKELGQTKQDAILYTDSSPIKCDIDSMGEFTGNKDMREIEVYEGDIVKSSMQENRGEWNDFEAIGVVTYFSGYAQFLIKRENNHPQLGFDLFEMDNSEHYEVLELEVIGNIYENKKLV